MRLRACSPHPRQNSGGSEPFGKKIFVTHKPSYELTPDTPAVEVLFRIEKVSSKIGLFKLYIEPDYGDGAQGPVGGVFTDNIEVKSKVNDKAKAQYIDSIQNILVPVSGHPGVPGMMAAGIPSLPQSAGIGRAPSDHGHLGAVGGHAAAAAARGHHLGGHVVGGGAAAASSLQVQHQDYLAPAAPAVSSARAHVYHGGRADGGGGSASGGWTRLGLYC